MDFGVPLEHLALLFEKDILELLIDQREQIDFAEESEVEL